MVGKVRGDQVDIAYEFIGEGDPTFLVIPHWFLSSRSMRPSALIRRLAERHRVLLYDRRGTGGSDKPGTPYSHERDCHDLVAMMDTLDVSGVVVLGHGVRGSQLALHYAGHHPERVRAVICIGGTPRLRSGPEWPYGLSEAAWDAAFGQLERDEHEPAGASIAMREDWEACGREAAMDMLRRTSDEDLRSFLPKVSPPVLVLHLRGDHVVPFEAARWLAESLPQGTLEVFDAPREVPLRAYEELADHIEEFLRATVG